MDLAAQHRSSALNRRALAAVLAATACALTMATASPAQATSSVTAWGANEEGQLAVGTTTGPEKCGLEVKACSTSPVAVSGLSGVTAVSAGKRHGLALMKKGTVMAWGNNDSGQLGNGTTKNSSVPVAVSGLKGVTAVSAGSHQSLALLSDGTVMAWGEAPGNGTERSEVPVAVSGLSGVVAIAAGGGGFDFSLALLSNGTVMAWGNNSSGQLGNGSTTSSKVPVAVCALFCSPGAHLEGVTAIAAGAGHSLARLSNGAVVAWGYNGLGQLGDGTETDRHKPVFVGQLSGVSAISAGEDYSLALLSDRTVMAWGVNNQGELGNGTFTGPETCLTFSHCSKTPVAVSKLSEVTAIAAGGEHGLALRANRTVMAWGANEKGQLGDGTSAGPETCVFGSCSTTPVAVCAAGTLGPCPIGPDLSDVEGIAGGGQFSLAFGPPPAVTNVNPSHGPPGGGTSVSITGTDFTGASAVKFGSTSATSFTVNSATSITAVSPAGTGVVDVTVTNNWGTSATSSADQFSYEPPPTVTGVEPNHGPAAGGTSVTITGTNLTGTNAVKFGSTNAASFKVNSDTSITAVSPAATGTIHVTVTTPSGTSPTSSADQFTYGPTVTKVEPNHGSPSGGTTVTITGTGFTGATAVEFGSTTAASFKVISATSITAVSPKAMGALTVDVTVTTPAGTSPTSSADRFTYTKK
jgi:alpha-tubulin suppressor-like RCC1 family protein